MAEAARVTKNERIDELFAETWGKCYSNVYRDGILCEEDFEAQSVRVLSLAKEVHGGGGGDMREAWLGNFWKSKKDQPFENALSKWAYGILNNFPSLKEMDDEKRFAAFKSIAIVNVKKTGGGSTSRDKVITEFARQWRNELQRQIEIIGPDVIVSGNVPRYALDALLPALDLKHTGCYKPPHDKRPVGVGRWGNYKVIDFRHPSRAPHRAYDVLRDVFQSEAFKAL